MNSSLVDPQSVPAPTPTQKERLIESRIELLWILFVVIYAGLAPHMSEVSDFLRHPKDMSLFLPGAMLALFQLAATARLSRTTEGRKSLLIAVAAIGYLVSETAGLSSPDYPSLIAGIFLFSLCFYCAWCEATPQTQRLVKKIFIVTLVSTLCAFFCNLANLAVYYTGVTYPQLRNHSSIAATSVGAFGGILCGSLYAWQISGYTQPPRRFSKRAVLTTLVFAIIFAAAAAWLSAPSIESSWSISATSSRIIAAVFAISWAVSLANLTPEAWLPRTEWPRRIKVGLTVGLVQGLIILAIRTSISPVPFHLGWTMLIHLAAGAAFSLGAHFAVWIAGPSLRWIDGTNPPPIPMRRDESEDKSFVINRSSEP